MLREHDKPVPVFVYCWDKNFYENPIYQDNPLRREWFLCFDPQEPAELVVKRSSLMQPKDILTKRGFPWHTCFNGRSCERFFGAGEDANAPAVSWFVSWRKNAPLPPLCKYDFCDGVWPVIPWQKGVFFGWKKA